MSWSARSPELELTEDQAVNAMNVLVGAFTRHLSDSGSGTAAAYSTTALPLSPQAVSRATTSAHARRRSVPLHVEAAPSA
jgi:hypothetical protein